VTTFEVAASNERPRELPEAIARFMLSRAAPGQKRERMSMEEAEILVKLRAIPTIRDLEKIMRVETHILRLRNQTMHQFEALQARRRGEQTPLARLDVDVTVADSGSG
jgi:hypothetical protein